MTTQIDASEEEISRIVEEGLLHPAFQPILDFRLRGYFGFDASIRGPERALRHDHANLRLAAQNAGIGRAFEHACLASGLRSFARHRLPGRLFVDLTAESLLDESRINGETRGLLKSLGLPASRIVIKLSQKQPIADVPGIQEALLCYRSQGFQFAIENIGDHVSDLRMWSEIRPEFGKVDQNLVNGLADDRAKYQFIRATQSFAEICGTSLIASGVKRAEDFTALNNMGVAFALGEFVAPADVLPESQLRPAVLRALGQQNNFLAPGLVKTATALDLLKPIPPVTQDDTNESVIERFEANPELDVLPVVDGDLPVGLINRHSMIDRFARPFRKEVFGRKSCQLFMDNSPLIVDQGASLQELAMMLALAPKHHLLDGFIVTGDGRYLGIGGSHDLMAMITEMQISAARYANPLTQLPGNVPINEQIDRMLAANKFFDAAYIDIDNFKPYNDTYGYRRGDDVIQLLGRLICQEVDQKIDFVGHIGGDDFFVVFQSPDWEKRCWAIVQQFDALMVGLVNIDEHTQGGYLAENRKGEVVFQALPTLSIGALSVSPGECESHREVAAAASVAKKQAKKLAKTNAGVKPCGRVFVERRRLGPSVLTSAPGRALN
ncbi:MAG: EAL domain-containing protein [Rhodocyclaceae bacterium]|nr:EAL domain-containing protein [Rhodocyclaceae bacterium]